MRRLVVASLLSLAFVPAALVLHPREAAACSCMPSPGPIEAAQSSDVVFQAKLLSVADAPKGGQYDIPSKVFTFEVERTFKGQLDGQVRVITADNSAACGRAYGPEGSQWLIYARREDSAQLRDNLCSRTMSLDKAAADIAELEANPDKLDDASPEPEIEDPGPAEPEPEPIQTGDVGIDIENEQPEPTPKPKRCAVTDDTPAGGLAGLLTLGLGLAFVRRRRRR